MDGRGGPVFERKMVVAMDAAVLSVCHICFAIKYVTKYSFTGRWI
jgi:hypothetical protein